MVQKRTIGFWAAALLLGTLAIPAFGQPQPGGGRAQFMQQMNDRLKAQLGVTDDEYKALQPKIEAVMTAQRSTRGGGFGGGRNRGGNGGTPAAADPNAPPPTPTQAATTALQATLDNKDAKPEEIKEKLTALRDARAKAKEELAKAQADLKELLTQRQEAVLVNMGLLD
jgi:Spy/CpxP family protein refolding chaperone